MNELIKADASYRQWITEIGRRFKQSQIKAAMKVNDEMLRFYWLLGRDISEHHFEALYGSGFYNKLSEDLQKELPDVKSFSTTNLRYMSRFYELYPDAGNVPQVVATSSTMKLSPSWGPFGDGKIVQRLRTICKGQKGHILMFYHASPVAGIKVLEPRISNDGIPLIYFSSKRENTLVYLSNAIEKFSGYVHEGKWQKWGPYGFTKDKILVLQEYYPNALQETYEGVSAYVYCVDDAADVTASSTIPFAFTADQPQKVSACEYIPDAYAAILQAADEGKIKIARYEELSEKMLAWIRNTMTREYAEEDIQDDYRFFIEAKFPFVLEAP